MIELDYDSTIKGKSPLTIQCQCCETIIEMDQNCRIYIDNKYQVLGVACLSHPIIKIKTRPIISYGDSIKSVIKELANKECSRYISNGCVSISNDPAAWCAVCFCKWLETMPSGPSDKIALNMRNHTS